MKLSKREFLKTTAVVGASAAASVIAPKMAAAQSRNILRVALAAQTVKSLDPHYMTLGPDNWTNRHVFNCLVDPPRGTFNMDLDTLVGELAEKWEVSPDSKQWTIHLRKGVKWHKGYGEVSAEDVVFSYQRMANLKSTYSPNLVEMASVEALDQYTVRFNLKAPDPLFHAQALISPMFVVPKKAVTEMGDAKFAMNPIGSGPFVFEKIDVDRGVVLSANPDYFDGRPAIDGIEFRYMADPAARTLGLVKGDLDMIDGARLPGWMDDIKKQVKGATINSTAPGSLNTLFFNMNIKPFDDIRVRKALRYAIDREVFPAAFGTMATGAWGINPIQVPGALTRDDLDEDLRYELNPEKAKALLAEAGYPNGLEFKAYVSQREDYSSLMLLVQEMLRKSNINMKLDLIDHTAFHANRRKDTDPIVLYSKSYAPIPWAVLVDLYAGKQSTKADGGGGDNHSHYGDVIPGIDDILDKIVAEPKLDARLKLIHEAEKKILTDMPAFTLTTLSVITVMSPRVNLGFKVNACYPQFTLSKATLAKS